MRYRVLVCVLITVGFWKSSFAQFDFRTQCAMISQTATYGPLVPLQDSNEVHSPKKATVMSAIIPGLGQVYNKKYWKVGVLYAAGFGLGYGLKYNNDSLKGYQQALVQEIEEDTNYIYPDLSRDKINSERDYYRNNRDRFILGFGLLYALQIIDANVDAHLREFDVNKDLAWKPKPSYIQVNGRLSPAIGLSFRFK